MPAFVAARQFERPAEAWFAREAVQRLLREEQRQVADDLACAFGRYGLSMRPTAPAAPPPADHGLQAVLALHRAAGGFAGDMYCEDAALPVASTSISFVYAEHVVESSPEPQALVGEIARVLKPEGVAGFVVFNPLGLARLRWSRRGLRAVGAGELTRWVLAAGLEVRQCRHLGALWSASDRIGAGRNPRGTMIDRFRSSYFLLARRREAGVTPLRIPRAAAVGFKPGMHPG